MSIGKRIKSLRSKQGLTQKQLAEKIGIAQKDVSLYENDSVVPSALVLKELALALKSDANFLLDLTPAKNAGHPLMKMLREIEHLPKHEYEALMALIEKFIEANAARGKKEKK